MREVQNLFRQHFNQPPVHVVKAPGRLELLGNHTDYNEGLVMSLAVDKHVFIASAPRADGKIELVSSAFPGAEKFWLSDIKKNPAALWADYIKGVLFQLRQRGVPFTGFNAAVHSTLPIGAGMSSSAALEVATALTVRRLCPYTLTDTGITVPPQPDARGELPPPAAAEKLNLAKLCRAAEAEFVGVKCGLLDQISSLSGKAWHAMSIDCRHLTVEYAPLAGEAFVICDTGVRHSLVDGAYNELREQCESAAAKLRARSLRSVELKDLKASKSLLTEREYECAHHVVNEIQRVVFAERALRDDDHAQFGQYMFQSHESSRDYLRNSCAELDLLVELARDIPGCLGARLTGGGFGGATINLVAHHQVAQFMETISRQYEERSGRPLKPVLCLPADGAA